MIGVIDYGSQYTHLILKNIRRLSVYSEIVSINDLERKINNYSGIIISGSPKNISDNIGDIILWEKLINKVEVPILGICYGAQLLASIYNCVIVDSSNREYGRTAIKINSCLDDNNDLLFDKIPEKINVWMSHSNSIIISEKTNISVKSLASSASNNNSAAFKSSYKKHYGLQFHPEVYHTSYGKQIIENYIINICNAETTWEPYNYVEKITADIIEQVRNDHVLMAVSGGVDSTTAAKLIEHVIGDKLHLIFVNNGLLRKGEPEEVIKCLQIHIQHH